MKIDKNQFTNAVLGLAVGDALGMPYETGVRGEYDIYADAKTDGGYRFSGYKNGMPAKWYEHDMPPGTWTDDTSMTLAEIESIARTGGIDLDDIMKNFCRWFFEGEFTAHGETIGQGRRTAAALTRYRDGAPLSECGGRDERDNGNGSLMRMLPFAFIGDLMDKHGVTVRDLSSMTHAHEYSVKSCEIYADFARRVLAKRSVTEALEGHDAPFDRLGTITSLPESEIKSSVYVVDTLEAALWCFLTTDTYEDCVLKAVNLGGDTDTIAAIAGGLAGINRKIPREWIDALARKDHIIKLCADFAEAVNKIIY